LHPLHLPPQWPLRRRVATTDMTLPPRISLPVMTARHAVAAAKPMQTGPGLAAFHESTTKKEVYQ